MNSDLFFQFHFYVDQFRSFQVAFRWSSGIFIFGPDKRALELKDDFWFNFVWPWLSISDRETFT